MTHLCFFLPTFAGGGAEAVTIELAAGLADLGLQVDLVVGRGEGELRGRAQQPGVRLIDLGASRAVLAAVPLSRYLRRERPDVLIAVLAHVGVVAWASRVIAHNLMPLVVMQHNTLSVNVANSPHRRDRLVAGLLRFVLPRAAAVCAVSAGVADDLSEVTNLPRNRITVMPNPINYDRIFAMSKEPLPADLPGNVSVIVAAGRLTAQKDLPTLIRAVAQLNQPVVLELLGDGPDRAALENLASQLGISAAVTFRGFVDNPYPFFARADVYAMSSLWEGLPTVLLEVLAFDTVIVSTDCRSGPREILGNGALGTLVPVSDVNALTQALRAALAREVPATDRTSAREYYSKQAVCRRFADLVEKIL